MERKKTLRKQTEAFQNLKVPMFGTESSYSFISQTPFWKKYPMAIIQDDCHKDWPSSKRKNVYFHTRIDKQLTSTSGESLQDENLHSSFLHGQTVFILPIQHLS